MRTSYFRRMAGQSYRRARSVSKGSHLNSFRYKQFSQSRIVVRFELICERRQFGKTKPNGRSIIGTAESSTFCGFLSGPLRDLATLQTRPTEERLWTSKIRILNGGFWRTNRS